jgi:hypothetical protein
MLRIMLKLTHWTIWLRSIDNSYLDNLQDKFPNQVVKNKEKNIRRLLLTLLIGCVILCSWGVI